MLPAAPAPTDEQLAVALASGELAALATLHRRYAPLLTRLARRSVDEGSADEVVQEVFVALWQKAEAFDPARGPFRPWLLQIARRRLANALRSQRRRAPADLTAWDAELAEADGAAPPDDALWLAHRRAALRDALQTLPVAQRQALSLAFLDEMTHDEVARTLALPLGTAKTRIRAGLAHLRTALAPLAVAVLAALAGVAIERELTKPRRARAALEDEALRLVTSSSTELLHLPRATPALPPERHGSYRSQPGAGLAVVTLTAFPPAASGQRYGVWARHGESWARLGTATPGLDGHALEIYRVASEQAARPDEVLVVLEVEGAIPAVPAGDPQVRWVR